MARYRRQKSASDIFDLVLPAVGLLALAIVFVPGVRQMLGFMFVLVLWLAALSVVGLIALAIWRRTRTQPPPKISTAPTVRPAPPELNWSQELLSKLEWKRFEDVVAAYSRELGYEARTTRIGADGGVDVQLFQNGQIVMIIQCKAWDAYKVGVKPVRELFGVMAADKVANGAFFTTGEFTTEAEDWAREKNLDLVNGRKFLSRINQLTTDQQKSLLTLATAGDYTTPTCPSCGVKMVFRTANKGPNEGRGFYGCRNYPRCRQTFKIPQHT